MIYSIFVSPANGGYGHHAARTPQQVRAILADYGFDTKDLTDEHLLACPHTVGEMRDGNGETEWYSVQRIEVPEDPDRIDIGWCVEDVMAVVNTLIESEDLTEELTEEQAREILRLVERRHDATQGVTWDTLEAAVLDYVRDNQQTTPEE